jgi:hypothetical protein
MSSASIDPVAALAAIDADAITEAAAAGLVAGPMTEGGSVADIALVRYLEHAVSLARALPERDLLKVNVDIETFFERLHDDDDDDLLEETIDELVLLVIGPAKTADVPDEATTEAAVLVVDGMVGAAAGRLFQGVLRPAKTLRH